jgi:hypothetical protein
VAGRLRHANGVVLSTPEVTDIVGHLILLRLKLTSRKRCFQVIQPRAVLIR